MNAKRPKYPIGIQSFEKLRMNDYLYIDKTKLIYQLVNTSDYVFLSRPRRFGKSLLLSTLEAYFLGRKDLFEGLDIYDLERDWVEYPVLHMSLTGVDYNDASVRWDVINNYLESWEREYGESDAVSIGVRFRNVIEKASARHGHPVVILIDEYDKPLIDVMHDPSLLEQIRRELEGFYSALKNCDRFIRFACLSGITKFGHVSIFSGLNNLKDISLMPAYNTICGISESEFQEYFADTLQDFAGENGMTSEEARSLIRKYYDGYHFARSGEGIYNPFSVLNAFDSGYLRPYWFKSGTPSHLIDFLRNHDAEIPALEGAVRNSSELEDLTNLERDVVPLLYQSGYLTIKNWDSATDRYTLGFPNREVSEGFWTLLAESMLFFKGGASYDTGKFTAALMAGDPERFLLLVKSLFAGIPSAHEPVKEIHFHVMMAVLTKMLGLQVGIEVASGRGRSDMEVFTPQYVYIFEFKVDESAQSALAQIRERGYADPYASDPRCKYLIGVEFSSRERTLADWIVERNG